MTELDEQWGSRVARGGFQNEEDVADKFRDWDEDTDAQQWLEIMGYTVEDITSLTVENLNRNVKSDIRVTVHEAGHDHTEGISIKRAKESANYNQVDKRWVEDYAAKWDMPKTVATALKMFVGRKGYKPDDIEDELDTDIDDLKDERRLYFDELPEQYRDATQTFFQENRERIMRDILEGEPPDRTDWILVTQIHEDETRWTLMSIGKAIDVVSGDFSTTRRGNMKLGAITIQRKGGDNGRETAQMLQFKMKPFDLVDT